MDTWDEFIRRINRKRAGKRFAARELVAESGLPLNVIAMRLTQFHEAGFLSREVISGRISLYERIQKIPHDFKSKSSKEWAQPVARRTAVSADALPKVRGLADLLLQGVD